MNGLPITKTDPLTENEWDELITLRNHLGLLAREKQLPMAIRKQLNVCRIIVERINHAHDSAESCLVQAEQFDDEWPNTVEECWEAIR